MSTQPTTWAELMDNDHYDAVKDEASTVPDTRAASLSGTRRPALDSAPAPSGVGGSPQLASVVSPVPNPVTRGGRTAGMSPTSGRRGANRKTCLCGRVGDPTFPWGYCPGGRDCMDAINALHEEKEAPVVAVNDAGAIAA